MATIKAWMNLNFGGIPPLTELAALERLKKLTYKLVSTLRLHFDLISSSFLQVTRTTIKARMSWTFHQIGLPMTAELAVLERLKIRIDLQLKNCCDPSSAYFFEWIFFILAGNKDNH